MYLFSCSRLRFSVLLLGLQEEHVTTQDLMSARSPAGQLKDELRWLERTLTDLERTAHSQHKHRTDDCLRQKGFLWTRKGASLPQQSWVWFRRDLGFETQTRRWTRGRIEHSQISHTVLRIQRVSTVTLWENINQLPKLTQRTHPLPQCDNTTVTQTGLLHHFSSVTSIWYFGSALESNPTNSHQ